MMALLAILLRLLYFNINVIWYYLYGMFHLLGRVEPQQKACWSDSIKQAAGLAKKLHHTVILREESASERWLNK